MLECVIILVRIASHPTVHNSLTFPDILIFSTILWIKKLIILLTLTVLTVSLKIGGCSQRKEVTPFFPLRVAPDKKRDMPQLSF